MALVIQQETGDPVYTPYERPPQPYTLWSAIPRGLQSFVWGVRALDLIAVGDDALLELNATLPPNFGYVMADANLTVAMVGAGPDWSGTFNLNLQNFYRGTDANTALSSDFVGFMTGAAVDDSTKSIRMDGSQAWPRFPIVGSATGILVVLSAFNRAQTARAAGVFNGYMSFWQFDLEQIRKFPINTPQPVHAR